MKYFLIVIVVTHLIIASSFTLAKICNKLKNGIYRVELDSMFKKSYDDFEFKIMDTECRMKRKDSLKYFKIEWISKCSFRLKDVDKKKTSLSDFQEKLTGLGTPFYDIVKVKKDTSYFIYRVNLHVQIYSGKLIRIENRLDMK